MSSSGKTKALVALANYLADTMPDKNVIAVFHTFLYMIEMNKYLNTKVTARSLASQQVLDQLKNPDPRVIMLFDHHAADEFRKRCTMKVKDNG